MDPLLKAIFFRAVQPERFRLFNASDSQINLSIAVWFDTFSVVMLLLLHIKVFNVLGQLETSNDVRRLF